MKYMYIKLFKIMNAIHLYGRPSLVIVLLNISIRDVESQLNFPVQQMKFNVVDIPEKRRISRMNK